MQDPHAGSAYRMLGAGSAHMEKGLYSLCACSMATNASISQGKLKGDLGMCSLLTSVVGSPHLLTLFPYAV